MLSRANTQLNETQQKLDSRSALIKSEIEERTPRLIKAIEEKEGAMLQELENVVNNKKLILSKQLDQLQSEHKRLETLHKFAGKNLLFLFCLFVCCFVFYIHVYIFIKFCKMLGLLLKAHNHLLAKF